MLLRYSKKNWLKVGFLSDMHTYVIFLRGINVSGHNIIKMAEFKKLLELAGFEEVQTLLQSGNIILNSVLRIEEIEQKIAQLIYSDYQFEIEVFGLEKSDFLKVLREFPFDIKSLETKKLAVTFLKGKLVIQNHLDELLQTYKMPEQVIVGHQVLYSYYVKGLGRSKFDSKFIERKLNVKSTTRNINTLIKLQNKLRMH